MSIPKFDIGHHVDVHAVVEQISINEEGVFYQVAFNECALHSQFGSKAIVSEEDLSAWIGDREKD